MTGQRAPLICSAQRHLEAISVDEPVRSRDAYGSERHVARAIDVVADLDPVLREGGDRCLELRPVAEDGESLLLDQIDVSRGSLADPGPAPRTIPSGH